MVKSEELFQQKRYLILTLLPAMVLPCLGSLIYFVWMSQSKIANGVYGSIKVFTLLWPFLVVCAIEGHRPRWSRINWGRHVRALPLGLAMGGILFLLTWFLYTQTPLGHYVRSSSDRIVQKVVELGWRDNYILMVTFLSLVNSLVEEIYWRWFVFGRLERLCSPWKAYLLASLSFAAHHYVVLGQYFDLVGTVVFGTLVGAGGGIWCWLYRRQRTLVGCWVCHILVDAVIMWIGYQLIFN